MPPAGDAGVGLGEGREDPRPGRRGHTDPGIGHFEPQSDVRPGHFQGVDPQSDLTALGKFDRVTDQVDDDLFQPDRIAEQTAGQESGTAGDIAVLAVRAMDQEDPLNLAVLPKRLLIRLDIPRVQLGIQRPDLFLRPLLFRNIPGDPVHAKRCPRLRVAFDLADLSEEALSTRRCSVRYEHFKGVAAVLFGPVHGVVGVPGQFDRIAAMVRVERNPDAGGNG